MKSLLKRGVPLQAVALEAHIDAPWHANDAAYINFIRALHDCGVEVYVSELDDERHRDSGTLVQVKAAVAQTYRDYLIDALSAIPLKRLIFWSMSDRFDWYGELSATQPRWRRPDGQPHHLGLTDENFAPNPAYSPAAAVLANRTGTPGAEISPNPSIIRKAHPMRTALIFRERLLAPSETFIVEQARALRRYHPVLVGLRRTEPSLDHPLLEILLSDGAGIMDKISANLYRRIPVGLEFFRLLRAVNPSVIHAHFATDAIQALPIASKLDLPLIVSLHGYDVTSSDDSLRKSFSGRHLLENRNKLFGQASVFLCVSGFIRDAAVRAGFPGGQAARSLYGRRLHTLSANRW